MQAAFSGDRDASHSGSLGPSVPLDTPVEGDMVEGGMVKGLSSNWSRSR